MASAPTHAPWLVVTDRLPGPTAGLPEDRERARRIADLAAVVPGPVRLAVVEPGLGAADARWAAAAGVELHPLTTDPVASLAELVAGAGAVLATTTAQVRLLRTAGWSDATPLVLDLHDLPSAAHAEALGVLHGIKADGHEAVVDLWRSIDAGALAAATVVLTGHDLLAPVVAAPGAVDARVVPIGAEPAIAPFGAQRRRSLVAPGAWSLEPGTPDEDAAPLLVDGLGAALDVTVVLAGLDVDPRLRLVAAPHATAAPAQLDRAVRAASAALVVRHRGLPVPSRLVELARLGVPVVATTAAGGDVAPTLDALRAAVEPLLDDVGARDAAIAAGQALVRDRHDPATCRAALAEVLAAAGLDADAQRTAPVAAPVVDVGERRAGSAGSLSAADPAVAELERRLLRGPFLSRIQAIRLEHPVDEDRRYRLWAATWNQPSGERRAPAPAEPPAVGISFLVPTWNTDPEVLTETIESVLDQTDGRWELCLADDASTSRATHHVLDRVEGSDPRIRIVRLDANQGIAGASNAALGLATLPYVGLLDHDDLLAADAVAWVLEVLEADPDLDYVYTDEDKLDPYGLRGAPFCKPDWNPDLLLSCNYLTHLSVLRRSLVEEVGGFRAGFDGSQDYDLLLRVTERTDRIAHVARPLYTWRQVEGSTAIDTRNKPAAHGAGRRALEEALERRGVRATVTDGHMPTWHRVHHLHDEVPLVTVVIPTRDRVELVRGCVERVRRSVRHPRLELLVVDNQSTDPATVAWLAEHERSADGTVVRYPHEFSYARQMNLAAAAAKGSVLLMLNNDAKPRSEGWFEALLEHALRPEVGVVGGRLRFPDGRAQHEGIILNVGGPAYNLDSGPKAEWGQTIRDVVAVTGATMMCRTAVYHEAGGFEERLRVAFNDVDFCLRVGELGYRVVYTPYAELEHAESASRGALHPLDDEAFHLERWGPPYAVRDPFYNHTMDLMHPLMFRV